MKYLKYFKEMKETYTDMLRKTVLKLENSANGHCSGDGGTGHCSGLKDENVEKEEKEIIDEVK